jgi:hypothetical protein
VGAPIPALCENCGRLFVAPYLFGVSEGDEVNVTLENVGVGPCPHCGGTGIIPSGSYRLTSNTARYLGALPADDLRKLRNLLVHAQQAGSDAARLADAIAEEVPAAAPLAQELGEQTRASFQIWLPILIAMISVMLQFYSTVRSEQQPTLTEQQIEQAMEQAIKNAGQPQAPSPSVGRNQPCPCGSGKKYKHCHGR